MSRRDFHGLAAGSVVAAATAAGCSSGEINTLATQGYLLPPPNAKLQTTACAYCIVGCGYKAYSWPVGERSGTASASDNAFGVEFPVAPMSGYWVSPQMYSIVTIEGQPHHLIVIPDAEATVVNIGGDHSLGGSLARRFYQEEGDTRGRMLEPKLRVGDQLVSISWEEATALAGELSRHVLETRGPLAWGMKSYSYQFFENTYAITKFVFGGIKTPCWSSHDQPCDGSSTPGLSDIGVNAFSAAYSDWAESEVLFVSGVGLYEQRGVLFSQWISDGPKLIVVNPRRDETADYALETGGLFLQVRPGTDTLLHHAIARIIIEEGWQDTAFIAEQIVNAEELAIEKDGKARRARFAADYVRYRQFIMSNDEHRVDNAAAVTGVSADDIRAAARMMASPSLSGVRPKTSLMLEKGNYWSHNYANSASLASLALLVGAGNRPGQVLSRGGGHQRGMLKGGSYPLELSPEEMNGTKVPLNLDNWLLRGKLSLAWAVGCTWMGGGSAHSAALFEQVRRQARSTTLPQVSQARAFPSLTQKLDLEAVLATLKAKIDQGGMVFIQQDIYPQALTELADLVLPAASWGEAPFTRMQGERRLRHYAQLADPPGNARADWRIIADIARYMGMEGFDWEDENEIFEEGAPKSAGKTNDYVELVNKAKRLGVPAHSYLSSLGTTGIQCPIKEQNGELVGTVRLHENGFSTATKKAMFVVPDYQELVVSRDHALAPRQGELQIINRRAGSSWSSLVEDENNSYRASQLPDNFLEISQSDAATRGIAEGDLVTVSTDGLMDKSVLPDNGHDTGQFQARAVISTRVQDGVACTYFNFRGNPAMSANAVVPNTGDPVTGLSSFKLGRGTVTK